MISFDSLLLDAQQVQQAPISFTRQKFAWYRLERHSGHTCVGLLLLLSPWQSSRHWGDLAVQPASERRNAGILVLLTDELNANR